MPPWAWPGRTGIAFAQAEAADEGFGLFVVGELETHAIGVIVAASEAVVFLHADVAGVVAVACGFLRHRVKSIKPRRTQGYTKETYPQQSCEDWFCDNRTFNRLRSRFDSFHNKSLCASQMAVINFGAKRSFVFF